LRPETKIGKNVKIGNFVEIKKSEIKNNVSISHLSYIGDAEVGNNVNIGAGTITCNFDGERKHKTKIEDNAFIGSDTILVAPVKIGKFSYTGAGSTITKDVPDYALGIERTLQRNILNWKRRKKK
jgi:bifunctional UDP-N-acetylglucosamine pyrophosphorylase/glucosamine-1-phosphate N-acetyltransferase